MKKFKLPLQLLIVLTLAFSTILPFILPEPVYAQVSPNKVVDVELLDFGEERIDQYTKTKKIGTEFIDGQLYNTYETEISSLPQTLPDLKTKITVEWRGGKADDGIPFWETGNNIYWARITGTRVSVEYENILAAWDPDIYIGDVPLELKKGPTLVKDYFGNENYHKPNCIEWVYEAPKSLWQKIFGGQPFQVTRIIRQIEGVLQEFYIIESNPQGNFIIENNYVSEEGFIWQGEIFAYDSNGIHLKVNGGELGKFIDAREFGRPELTYPIIVDPPTPFVTSSYDGYYGGTLIGDSYSTIHDSTSETPHSDGTYIAVGQYTNVVNGYTIWRSATFFNTASLAGTTIDSAYIALYGYSIQGLTSFDVLVFSGMPTYPHMPLQSGDYYYGNYGGEYGGTLSASSVVTTGYNNLYLSSTGRSWINKSGWTKFFFRSSRDFWSTVPTGWETVGFYSYEGGSGKQPTLYVTYTESVTKPTISTWSVQSITETTATLRGYLSDDGGASCSVRFLYGTTDEYGSFTPPAGGKTSPYSWSTGVDDLSPGTLYYCTAEASNSEGPSEEDPETFLTRPRKPTNFVVTPGDGENVITWAKGTGAEDTIIRRSTSGYPTSYTSGTGVYSSDGVTYTDEDVSNGIRYYYSAWSFKDEGTLKQYSSDYAKDDGIPEAVGSPSIRTDPITEVTQETATFNGYLTSMQGADEVDVYFHYKEEGGEFSEVAADEGTLTEPGPFTKAISGLDADTVYIVKAKGVGYEGAIGWGDEEDFETGEPCAPTMETIATSTDYSDGATIYGKVVDDGGAEVTAWFGWGKTEACGTATDPLTGYGTGDNVQPVVLDGLDPDTKYYYQVVGQNEASELPSYGGVFNFTTTAPTDPEVTTLSAAGVGSTSATLRGKLDDDGGVECNARFQWSLNSTLSANVTTGSWVEGYRTGTPIEKYTTGLESGETWYYRVQVQHAWSGVINGTILNFETVFTAPTNFMALPQTSTSISLSWESQADETLIRGQEGSYPADRFQGVQVYKGPGDSTTWGNLDPGTTYFLRAWSVKEGPEYSDTYAEDAATTLSGVRPEDVGTPADSMNWTITTPGWMFQTPTSEHVQNWPGVQYIDGITERMGWPVGTMWMIIAVVGAILISGGIAIVLPVPWVAVAGGSVFIGLFSVAGLVAGSLLVMWVILGVAILVLIGRGSQ